MLSRDQLNFIICCILGGVGWIFAASQMDYMPAEMAVGFRFLLAGILTLMIAFKIKRKQMPKNINLQKIFFIQGILMFSMNYIFAYYALNFIFSGILSVILSLLVIPNSILEMVFFKRPYTLKKIMITSVGALGIIILFLGEQHNEVNFGPSLKIGTILCLCSMFFTSLGANLSQYLKKEVVDPIWAVGYAMVWGGLSSLTYSLIMQQKILQPLNLEFIVTLIGLSVLSALLFIGYQLILEKKGAGFAAYIWVITPAIALILSTYFENLKISHLGKFGIIVIILGGFLNLISKEKNYETQ